MVDVDPLAPPPRKKIAFIRIKPVLRHIAGLFSTFFFPESESRRAKQPNRHQIDGKEGLAMRVALYCRRSTTDLQPDSLDAQEEVLRAFCDRHRHVIVEE